MITTPESYLTTLQWLGALPREFIPQYLPSSSRASQCSPFYTASFSPFLGEPCVAVFTPATNEIMVTNGWNAILRGLDIAHHVAKLTFKFPTGKMLHVAEAFIDKKYHHTVICRGADAMNKHVMIMVTNAATEKEELVATIWLYKDAPNEKPFLSTVDFRKGRDIAGMFGVKRCLWLYVIGKSLELPLSYRFPILKGDKWWRGFIDDTRSTCSLEDTTDTSSRIYTLWEANIRKEEISS
ncbi:T-complex protein 1 subunit gamma [Tanacetum coccineum]